MRRIDQYIGRTILATVLMVLLVIVSLDVVFAFIGELEDLEGDYQVVDALSYVGLTIPRRVYDFISVATLIGCLIGLGGLANNSELVVMRAAGVSVLSIIVAAMRPILLAVGIGLILGQFVVPKTEQIAQSGRALLLSGDSAIRSRHGYWHREPNAFIHVNAIQPNGVLHGITRYEFDDQQRLVLARFAERAIYQGSYWALENVKTTLFEQNQTRVVYDGTVRSQSELTPEVLSIVVLEPDHLSISGLYRYARYLEKQALSAKQYFLAFWGKVFQPFATLAMVLIAVSFIFGPLRNVTMGLRVTAGVVTGLVFKYAQDLLANVSLVFDIAPAIAALLPIMICMGAGLYFILRVR